MTICGVRENPWPYACSIDTRNGLKFDPNTGKLWTDPTPPKTLSAYYQIDSGTVQGTMATFATSGVILVAPCAMRVIYRLSGNAGFCAQLGGTGVNSGTTFDIAMFNYAGTAFNTPSVYSANVRYGPLTQGAWTGLSNVAIQDVAAGANIGYILKYNIPTNPPVPHTSIGDKNLYIRATITVSFEISPS